MFTLFGSYRVSDTLQKLNTLADDAKEHMEKFQKQVTELTKLQEWLQHNELKHDIDFSCILIDSTVWTELLAKNKIVPEFILVSIADFRDYGGYDYPGSRIFDDMRRQTTIDTTFLKQMVQCVLNTKELFYNNRISNICDELIRKIRHQINENNILKTDIKYIQEKDIIHIHSEPVGRITKNFKTSLNSLSDIERRNAVIETVKNNPTKIAELITAAEEKICPDLDILSTLMSEVLHLKMAEFEGSFESYWSNELLEETIPLIINRHGYLFYDELQYVKGKKEHGDSYWYLYIISCHKYLTKIKTLVADWAKHVKNNLNNYMDSNLSKIVLEYLVD